MERYGPLGDLAQVQFTPLAEPAPPQTGHRVEFLFLPSRPEPGERPAGRSVELLDGDWRRRRRRDGKRRITVRRVGKRDDRTRGELQEPARRQRLVENDSPV